MATFSSFATLQPLQQDSPSLTTKACPTSKQCDQQPVSAVSELSRLTEQYHSEAARLAEQAEMVGVPKDGLSSQARLNLQLLALLASTLHLRDAKPNLILSAWVLLLVKESKATSLLLSLRLAEAETSQKLRAARAKKKMLQQVLHDLQTQQKRWAATVQEQKVQTGQLRQKTQQYHDDMAKWQKHLDREQFDEEITHAKLIEKQKEVDMLQQAVAQQNVELATYHCLPPSVAGAQRMLKEGQQRVAEQRRDLDSRLAAPSAPS